jgi:hypothetical protein
MDYNRRRKIADALLAQSMAPMSGGQMIGRYYVGSGITDGLTKLGQALIARNAYKRADEEEAAYKAEEAQKQQSALDELGIAISPQQISLGQYPTTGNMVEPKKAMQQQEMTPITQTVAPDKQRLARALLGAKAAGIDTDAYMKIARPEPIKLGKGERLLSADGYKPLIGAEPDLPEGMVMGPNGPEYIGSYISGQVRLRQAGRPVTNVSIDNKEFKSAFEKESGKSDAEFLDDLRKKARAAQDSLATLDQLNTVSDKVFSGAGANIKLGLEQFFGGMGVPMSQEAINSENFQSIAGQLVLDRIKMLGANPTDTDRKFIERLVPQLGSNPEARRQLIEFMRKKSGQVIRDYQDASSYANKNGRLGGWVGGGYEAAPDADANQFFGQ